MAAFRARRTTSASLRRQRDVVAEVDDGERSLRAWLGESPDLGVEPRRPVLVCARDDVVVEAPR